jgi:hypothetical protein
MTLRTTTDGVAAVNTEVFWVPITPETRPPRGAKLLLINRDAGVTLIGQYTEGSWFTHFAGLPVFKENK